jgi:hypothetical protein
MDAALGGLHCRGRSRVVPNEHISASLLASAKQQQLAEELTQLRRLGTVTHRLKPRSDLDSDQYFAKGFKDYEVLRALLAEAGNAEEAEVVANGLSYRRDGQQPKRSWADTISGASGLPFLG